MNGEALPSRELSTHLERELQVAISSTTLRMELKRLGYVRKRARCSFKNGGLKCSNGLVSNKIDDLSQQSQRELFHCHFMGEKVGGATS